MGESMNNKIEEKRGKRALHVNPQTQITYTLYTFHLYVLESLSADLWKWKRDERWREESTN